MSAAAPSSRGRCRPIASPRRRTDRSASRRSRRRPGPVRPVRSARAAAQRKRGDRCRLAPRSVRRRTPGEPCRVAARPRRWSATPNTCRASDVRRRGARRTVSRSGLGSRRRRSSATEQMWSRTGSSSGRSSPSSRRRSRRRRARQRADFRGTAHCRTHRPGRSDASCPDCGPSGPLAPCRFGLSWVRLVSALRAGDGRGPAR